VEPEPFLPAADEFFHSFDIAVLGVHDQQLVFNIAALLFHLLY
jgi:hypothetical protein